MDEAAVKRHFQALGELTSSEQSAYLANLLDEAPDVHDRVVALWRQNRSGITDALLDPVRRALPARRATRWPRLRGYDVVRPLGEGGMGTVYLATTARGEWCAIKVLNRRAAASGSGVRHRLVAEGRRHGLVRHPNVVRILQVAERAHRAALVMEFVQGPTLAQLLADEATALTLHEIDAIARGLLSGVAAIHRARLVHADLKPGNVLLSVENGQLVPKVADFGLAKPEGAEPGTMTQKGAGTPLYMSREQRYGDTPDAQWDVFALGAVLFELLEGRPALRDPEERARTLEEGEAPPMRRADVPERMAATIRASLARRGDRPRDARELLASWTDGTMAPSDPFLPSTIARAQALSSSEAHSPSTWRRARGLLVVGAIGDREAVDTRVEALSHGDEVDHVQVRYLHELGTDRAAFAEALEDADEVHVVWSAKARAHEQADRFLDLVEEEAWARAGGRERVEGYLHARSIDDTPLPAELDPTPGAPEPMVGVSTLVVAATMLYGWRHGWEGWASWLGLWIALLLGLWIALLQWTRRTRRIEWASWLYQEGQWLDRARLPAILGRAELLLGRIFGDRLLSWRSLEVSALISTVPVVAVALLWAIVFLTREVFVGQGLVQGLWVASLSATGSLVITLPIAVGSVVLDYASLLVTRSILRHLGRDPPMGWVAAGLVLDLLAVLGFGVLGICTNLFGLWFFGQVAGVLTAWPRFFGTMASLLVSGGLNPSNAVGDVLIGTTLITGVAVITAMLPSLIHTTLVGAGLINRALGHWPFELSGRALQTAALSPRGLWTIAHPALVAVVLAVTFQPPAAPPSAPRTASWPSLDLGTACPEPCTIGCDPAHLDCDRTEAYRAAREPLGIVRLQPTEVTQRQWSHVWDRARRAGLDRLGLYRQPSVYRGSELPVDSVSWCDALRFANLWTMVDAREHGVEADVAYCMSEPCDPQLRGCERHAHDVRWNRQSTGYRLPTEAEWEVTCRQHAAGAPEVAWLNHNSGWRSRGAASTPRPPPPGAARVVWGLRGNVAEWTWDLYEDPPACEDCPVGGRQVLPYLVRADDVDTWWANLFDPGANDGTGRVMKGGSWYMDARMARCAWRVAPFPAFRNHAAGFRLVRGRVPSRR